MYVMINILYTYMSAFSYMYAPMHTIVLYTSLPSFALSAPPTPAPLPIRFAHLFPNNVHILHIYTASKRRKTKKKGLRKVKRKQWTMTTNSTL